MARAPEPLPHANMVSCNHCRGGQTDESARDSRNVKSSLPARKPLSLHPLRAGVKGCLGVGGGAFLPLALGDQGAGSHRDLQQPGPAFLLLSRYQDNPIPSLQDLEAWLLGLVLRPWAPVLGR